MTERFTWMVEFIVEGVPGPQADDPIREVLAKAGFELFAIPVNGGPVVYRLHVPSNHSTEENKEA